ncbi:uncharacterized protein TRIVIDRAFT_200809 [Trichoderma virens Gv29-8]|uniref:Lysine-specific metallo-endopeptidase domain-containing protein n=1 Tax=Hypocrea virens (strain Gv29-8 / FGSC 10586) TaxID=413071 RepID=G9MQX3_HYPVG|nr:uncharacterized protein TRIVIDRAFT_200809 [Trichoderma virens Gv29-8]EHK22502.1 hypothetical protein TRIVIDRAFT_200809 [Trichoderma virens Gv29-8]UKZ47542.1 hypothetical protein TrVGV298_001763 [Trichoderma virens]
MRKHSLLGFTCYGAAAILSCLPGTWSAPVNTTQDELGFSIFEKAPRSSLMKRAITVDAFCGPYSGAVNLALGDALNIINYAIPRLQALLANLNSNPVPSIVGMNTADRTVFQTYEAFFGQAYFGTDTVTNKNKNAAAITRLNGIIRTAQAIQSALQNPGGVNVEIYCDDSSFLWTTDQWGFPGAAGTLFDSRYLFSAGIGEWVQLQSCSALAGTTAYTYRPNSPPFFGEDVIVLCGNYLPGWAARYTAGNTVGNYHNAAPLITNVYQMDYLWGYLPATLIHEFTHSSNIMNTQNAPTLADQCLINKDSAYQWQCIRQLAQENVDKAAANSDTFSLFVTAIYLNQNDWSTGIAQNLGYFPLSPT